MTSNAGEQKKKVFIVDDSAGLREGLGEVINGQADLIVCGEAENADQALERIPVIQPDIAIVDISLEGKSGIDLIKEFGIYHPTLRTLVFTMHESSYYRDQALAAGAQGYLTKQASMDEVLAAIRQILGAS